MNFEAIEDDFEPPIWWECTWRRVRCGKRDCPMCASDEDYERFAKERELKRRASPDYDPVWEEEKIAMLKEAEEEALAEMEAHPELLETGRPPRAEEFSLYRQVQQWYRAVVPLIEFPEQRGESWTKTEAFQDLSWYSTLITRKVYRQLFNRWELDRGDHLTITDYRYTHYVLTETLKIIKQSIDALLPVLPNKVALIMARTELVLLENDILNI